MHRSAITTSQASRPSWWETRTSKPVVLAEMWYERQSILTEKKASQAASEKDEATRHSGRYHYVRSGDKPVVAGEGAGAPFEESAFSCTLGCAAHTLEFIYEE